MQYYHFSLSEIHNCHAHVRYEVITSKSQRLHCGVNTNYQNEEIDIITTRQLLPTMSLSNKDNFQTFLNDAVFRQSN